MSRVQPIKPEVHLVHLVHLAPPSRVCTANARRV